MSELEKVTNELTEVMRQVLDNGGTEPAWESWAHGWLAGSPRARSREATLAALRLLEAATKFRDAMLGGDIGADMPNYTVHDWRSLESRLAVTEGAMCLARGLWAGARQCTEKVAKIVALTPSVFNAKQPVGA